MRGFRVPSPPQERFVTASDSGQAPTWGHCSQPNPQPTGSLGNCSKLQTEVAKEKFKLPQNDLLDKTWIQNQSKQNECSCAHILTLAYPRGCKESPSRNPGALLVPSTDEQGQISLQALSRAVCCKPTHKPHISGWESSPAHPTVQI